MEDGTVCQYRLLILLRNFFFETFDVGLKESQRINLLQGDFKKRVTIEVERAEEKHAEILCGRQIAFIIYSHFSATSEVLCWPIYSTLTKR